MLDRRTLLGHAVVGLFGTAFAGGATAETDTSTPGTTTVSFTLSPTALRHTDLPPAVASRIARLEHTYRSFSLGAVDRLAGRADVSSAHVREGTLVASGSFDAEALANEIQRQETRFTRADESTRTPKPHETDTSRSTESPGQSAHRPHRFVDEETAETLEIDSSKITLARGRSATSDGAVTPLSTTGAVPTTGTRRGDRIASRLHGHAVVVSTLDDASRTHLRKQLVDAPDSVKTILRRLRVGGLGLQVGREQSRLRYVLDGEREADLSDALDAAVSEFARTDGVDEVERSRDGSLFVVEATVSTGTLWTSHERFLGR